MAFEQQMEFTWSDGNDPSSAGYFDGAHEFNHLLRHLFACSMPNNDRYPFGVDVMGSVPYGTKCKITVRIETG